MQERAIGSKTVITHIRDEKWGAFSTGTSEGQKAATASPMMGGNQPSIIPTPFSHIDLASALRETYDAIDLIYDSFTQPPPAGIRSVGGRSRQMLYRTDHHQIDMEIEAQRDGNRLVITGQVLDIGRPSIVDIGVQVIFSDGRGNIVHTMTNQFGEFRGEVDNSGDLELSFLSREGKSIIIRLREALDPTSRMKN